MSFGGFSEAFVNLYVAASKSLAFVFFGDSENPWGPTLPIQIGSK